jgi:hypothetical protein
MRVTLSQLRALIKEAVESSETYKSKEKIRGDLQTLAVDAIRGGIIQNETDLSEYFKTVDMAVKTLKMIPYDALVKLAHK